MSELAMQYQQNQQQGGVIGQATASREMEEVKGAIFLAKQFPRNIFQSEQRILDSCKRPSLAEVAMYQYPRGGTKVSGPSIRLAEVLAQNWGNISFGVKELEQREGESVAMAYAWDLETNVRQEKVFTVKHSRQAKGSLQKLTDPRDIYELVASSGARRVRACVLGIIPGDIVDKAVAECEQTLRGNNKGPLKDRIANALKSFKENYRVTQEMVEAKFGYNAESFTEYDYVELIKIFTSLKDGMSKIEDWFDKDAGKKKSSDLAEAFNKEGKKEVPVDGKAETPAEQPELSQQPSE
ncbi:hypothetical protein OR571_13395 [Psychrobacillus sp. NEAU-3TGS]|uniref:hypothetical protein n=1 Tax=Psychrobacillus sp. NEAU-3TGS TaxID=2995412 RepID=UPI00249768F4|nr:hypothetical protein [Psychrobacillus sp. NEAU-3TGS]MDI2588083.1 hypothetical protein [Psychrobacillus sp. NEAU-3TGS]